MVRPQGTLEDTEDLAHVVASACYGKARLTQGLGSCGARCGAGNRCRGCCPGLAEAPVTHLECGQAPLAAPRGFAGGAHHPMAGRQDPRAQVWLGTEGGAGRED